VGVYTIAPRNNMAVLGAVQRQPGQAGEAAFKRRINRIKGAKGGRR
jgi:hypothetical protein